MNEIIFNYLTILWFCYNIIHGTVIVETTSGNIEGHDEVSRKGIKFNSFLGIQYGNVTDRFQPAKLAIKSSETIKGDIHGPVCVQWNDNKDDIIGEENCLYLNVFTPVDFKKHSKFPVMMYIHGGAFHEGASNIYGPNFIMNENVVLVTINYRLGVLGFINGDDEEAPGNVGLKDQILALKWIKKNIKKFGGNPNKVTIFGESAGGASVSYLILSPMSNDLFHNAIVQSGSALSPWALTENHLDEFEIFAKMNKCITGKIKDIIKCLRETPLKTLMKNSIDNDIFLFRNMKTLPRQAFRPSIENCKKCEKFLPKSPEIIYQKGHFQKIPLMIGTNKDEATLFTLMGGIEKQENIEEIFKTGVFDKMAPQFFNFNFAKNSNEVVEKIKEFYFGGKSKTPTRNQFHQLLNDRIFTVSTRKTAMMHSKFNKHTYLYHLDRLSEISMAMIAEGLPQKDGKFEPTHGDDVLYLFSTSATIQNLTNEYYNFSEKLIALWVSFAINGKPTQNWGIEKEWEKVKNKGTNKWHYLNESPRNVEEDKDFLKRIEFWENLNV